MTKFICPGWAGPVFRHDFRFGLFLCAFPFPTPPHLSFYPHSLPYSSHSHFNPPFFFPKEVNKNVSYRRQNELSIIKTHEPTTHSELFLCICQSRLAGGIMFSTCPFFHPFVRLLFCLFICLLPTCECYILKTNEPILMQIGINLPRGKAMGRP